MSTVQPTRTPLRVTFDTNTLAGVVDPENEAAPELREDYRRVRIALGDGRLRGYFSEAVITLDAIGRKDKADVLGRARLVSETGATGPRAITIAIGPRWENVQIDARILRRLEGARALGIRGLIGPRRFGDSLVVRGFGEDFYEPYPPGEAFAAAADAANGLDAAIVQRGLGRAQVITLAKSFSARSGADGEWWPQGLSRTTTAAERKRVRAAVNEWADGEALAAHLGYANDLFCTHDQAAGHGRDAVLHPDHRAWLSRRGIFFVSIAELAAQLEAMT